MGRTKHAVAQSDKTMKREIRRIFAGVRHAVPSANTLRHVRRELAAKCLVEGSKDLIKRYSETRNYVDRIVIALAMAQKIVEESQKKEAILMIVSEPHAKAFLKALEYAYMPRNGVCMPNEKKEIIGSFLSDLNYAMLGKRTSKIPSGTAASRKRVERDKISDFDGSHGDVKDAVLRKKFWVYGDRGQGHPHDLAPLQIIERTEKQAEVRKTLLEILGTNDAINRNLIELMKAESEGNTDAIKALGERIRALKRMSDKKLKELERAE